MSSFFSSLKIIIIKSLFTDALIRKICYLVIIEVSIKSDKKNNSSILC